MSYSLGVHSKVSSGLVMKLSFETTWLGPRPFLDFFFPGMLEVVPKFERKKVRSCDHNEIK